MDKINFLDTFRNNHCVPVDTVHMQIAKKVTDAIIVGDGVKHIGAAERFRHKKRVIVTGIFRRHKVILVGIADIKVRSDHIDVRGNPLSGSFFSTGTTPVSCSITDAEGAIYPCSFTVTVNDTEKPVVSCPGNLTLPMLAGQCGAPVTLSATATDNCTVSPTINYSTNGVGISSNAFFPLGTTLVTATATDAAGNVSTPCTFNVEVVDYTGDAFPTPCWRGKASSTFQQWVFSTSASPGVPFNPELQINPNGTPQATVTLGAFASGWINQSSAFGCRQGLWDLGRAGTLALNVPDLVSAGGERYIRVQVTQFQDPHNYTQLASLAVGPSATQVGASVQTNIGTVYLGASPLGNWVVSETLWRLSASASADSIVITAGANGSLLDQVVVDTLNLQFAAPPNQTVTLAAGQCSTNMSWVTPAADACTNLGVISYINGQSASSPAAFLPGVTPVSVVITDAENAKLTNNFTVTVIDNQPPAFTSIAATEDQPYSGTVNVMNGVAATVQGTVNFTIQASVKACGSAPVVTLTNGVNTASATFVNQSPAGTYNYSWTVSPTTANGTWTATATAFDAADTVATSFTLAVNVAQITGQVQLDGFLGTGTVPPNTRAVTFVATTNNPVAGTNVLQSWTVTLNNVSGDTFNYVLTGVPPNANGLSAKTDWNLRKKLPVVLDANEQGVANFTDPSLLLGGDVNGDNIVNAFDYNVLEDNWFSVAPEADIVGFGTINAYDYNILENNWFITGDPQ